MKAAVTSRILGPEAKGVKSSAYETRWIGCGGRGVRYVKVKEGDDRTLRNAHVDDPGSGGVKTKEGAGLSPMKVGGKPTDKGTGEGGCK